MIKHKKRKWLSASEKREVYDLLDRGKKVPAIVRETGISRTKVYELKNEPRPTVPEMRLPANLLEQDIRDRCEIRSDEYPEGDHSWMKEDRLADMYYRVNTLSTGERPASPDDVKSLGYVPSGWRECTTIKTCWNCPWTTKVSKWWPIDLYAAIYDRPSIPC